MNNTDPGIIKPKVILFDVYETLLDMSQVERKLNAILKSRKAYIVWFELLMQYCLIDNAITSFNDFNSIAKATLEMTAHRIGEKIDHDETGQILGMLKHLPVNEDVQEGLSALHDLNIRIAAITNSSAEIVCERMESTGLISYFEKVLSAEHTKKYRPAPEVYQWAIDELKTKPGEMLFVSAHDWDILGANNAGIRTAYKIQKKLLPYPLGIKPDFKFEKLRELANKLADLQSAE
jgi:2-haloacid dehalogenase